MVNMNYLSRMRTGRLFQLFKTGTRATLRDSVIPVIEDCTSVNDEGNIRSPESPMAITTPNRSSAVLNKNDR